MKIPDLHRYRRRRRRLPFRSKCAPATANTSAPAPDDRRGQRRRAGAIAGGAEDILVNDSHGGFRNLLPDGLDERAAWCGKPRYLGMMGGLEEARRGLHDRLPLAFAGVASWPTHNSFAFARVFINGMELGEAGLYGALAGEMGVPVILATGDDVFISETSDLFPGAQWVQTKVAHGQGSGVTLSPAASPRDRGPPPRRPCAT